MGKPFFTKKQKAQMRERRQKKRKAFEDTTTSMTRATKEEQVASERQTEETKKRPRPEETAEEEPNHQEEDPLRKKPILDFTTKVVQGRLHVLVPANLSSKDAKKFRKGARRVLRKEGKDDKDIEFVVSHTIFPPKKKQKKQFPSIQELLKEKRQTEKEVKEEKKKQQKLDDVPESIKSQYIAMDCEMVGIGADGKKSALARVSLVDWYGKTVLDTFVTVPIRVTDFRTHVSGVEPKHLKENTAMEVDKCRKLVASLLKDKTLVGHALSNDLKALMLVHPKSMTRDTAKYRPFQRFGNGKWRARKLRDLVKENLSDKQDFQSAEHDSVEDAKATMELFQLVQSQWEREVANRKSK